MSKWSSPPNLLPTGEQSPFSSIGGILPPVGNSIPSLGPLLPKARLLETKAVEQKPKLIHEPVWEPIPNSSQAFAICSRAQHTLYFGARGPGKELANYCKILTDSGWKTVGEVVLTDKLVSIDGSYTEILGIFPQGFKRLWRITFDDGCSVVAGKDHLWTVGHNKNFSKCGYKVMTTEQLVKSKGQYGVPYLSFPCDGKKWEGYDPYAIGLMLGDGTMGSKYPTIYSADYDIMGYMEANHGWAIYKYDSVCYRAVAIKNSQSKPLNDLFPNKELAEFKSVPKDLMVADLYSRLAVLQGLMDTDGSIEKDGNKCRFVSKSRQLAEDVAELTRSLGGKATCYFEKRPSLKGGVDWRWRVNLTARNMFIPFRLARKYERVVPTKRVQNLRYIKSIVEVSPGTATCFSVAHPSKLFVIENHIVTHNTITQLMKFRSRVGIGYGSYWRGVIFDREFKHLSDLVAQSNRFFPKFNDGCRWLKSATEYMWEWPTGEQLLFRHVKKLEDYDAFHGHEYAFIGWNELTKYPTLELYDKFMSVNRSSFDPIKHTPKVQVGNELVYNTPDKQPLPSIPLEVFSTTNPHGPGHNAVKKRFIDVAKPGEIVKKTVTFYNNLTKKDIVVTRTQVAIFGSFYENPYLPDEYRAELLEICEKEPSLKAAWIYGSWDVSSGGAVDDLWDSRVHVVNRFKVPSGWKVDRSFDWGSTHPFAAVWWAEATGEEVKLEDGSTWCPNRGSLIAIDEFYGTAMIGTNKGLKMSAEDVAKGINTQERILIESGWVSSKIQSGPADNQIRNVTDSGTDTIETIMSKEGVRWTPSDKSPGSRIIGLQLFRDRLAAAKNGQKPAVYVTRNCRSILEIIPSLSRDPDKPDDIDTESEDHLWDAIRYRVLKGSNKWATKVRTNWAS